MRNFLPLVLTLSLIAMISGGTLAYFYQMTAPAIAEQKELALKQAIFEVVPDAKSFAEIPASELAVPASTGQSASAEGRKVFTTTATDGTPGGLAILAEGPGFQGMIKLMIGVDPNTKQLTGLKVLEQLETPGLGARIAEPWFQEQFNGKATTDAFVAKQDVEAITGATISSKAVATLVKQTLQELEPVLAKEAK